jgi:hypothetical protein
VQWEARHLAARLRTLRGTLAFLNEKPRQKAGAVGMAAWCFLWRGAHGWTTDRAEAIAETARLARRAAEPGKDDGR